MQFQAIKGTQEPEKKGKKRETDLRVILDQPFCKGCILAECHYRGSPIGRQPAIMD